MTEAEWCAVPRPRPMLNFLRGKASDRKLRLFAAGCCRAFNTITNDPCASAALEQVESYADGLIARPAHTPTRRNALEAVVRGILSDHAFSAACMVVREFGTELHGGLFRDIFGNPFRPVTLDPGCLTSDVLALATGIYADRDFSAMPILADALQDAGCDNDEVLDHCRDATGIHVRGCWVVDLLLGKS